MATGAGPALLQPGEVVNRQPGELRDLFTTQPRRAAPGARGEGDIAGRQPGAPVLEDGAELRGIGFAAARRLAEQGWTVLLGSRDPKRGAAAVAELGGLDVRVVPLDVTSEVSVAEAAKLVDADCGRLDVLINNAGIGGTRLPAVDVGADEMREVYETNVLGPVRMMRAFLPLLRRSAGPRVVMVSSGMGSLTITSDPDRIESRIVGLPYPSSKTALNMITSQYAKALPEFRINAVDPGYTATDLNAHRGFQTVAEGSDAIVALATVAPDGPTGGFFDRHGPVPW